MNADRKKTFVHTLIAASLTAAALAPAAAQADDEGRDHSFEGVLGIGFVDSDLEGFDGDVSTYGLRYGYDFSDRWGLEISYTEQPDFTFEGEDGRFLEASARLNFLENDRWRFFMFFGGGVLQYGRTEYIIVVGQPFVIATAGRDETATGHVGVGLNYSFGDRFYLRPEVRHRRIYDFFAPISSETTEASIAFGFRF